MEVGELDEARQRGPSVLAPTPGGGEIAPYDQRPSRAGGDAPIAAAAGEPCRRLERRGPERRGAPHRGTHRRRAGTGVAGARIRHATALVREREGGAGRGDGGTGAEEESATVGGGFNAGHGALR